MKGIFIPEITVEMFRNGCLESIETLMADGEVYDIEYDPKSAEPRKKGKWEYFSENIDGLSFGIKRCSMCGASKPMKLFHWEDTEINFCPNCGADMREDT